jgi:hypothetical protein
MHSLVRPTAHHTLSMHECSCCCNSAVSDSCHCRVRPGESPRRCSPGPEPAHAHTSQRQAAAHDITHIWPVMVHQPAPAVRHDDEHTLHAETSALRSMQQRHVNISSQAAEHPPNAVLQTCCKQHVLHSTRWCGSAWLRICMSCRCNVCAAHSVHAVQHQRAGSGSATPVQATQHWTASRRRAQLIRCTRHAVQHWTARHRSPHTPHTLC